MSLLFTMQSAASSSIAGGLLGVRAQPRPGSGCGPAQGAAGAPPRERLAPGRWGEVWKV